jgi:hypothetical protein
LMSVFKDASQQESVAPNLSISNANQAIAEIKRLSESSLYDSSFIKDISAQISLLKGNPMYSFDKDFNKKVNALADHVKAADMPGVKSDLKELETYLAIAWETAQKIKDNVSGAVIDYNQTQPPKNVIDVGSPFNTASIDTVAQQLQFHFICKDVPFIKKDTRDTVYLSFSKNGLNVSSSPSDKQDFYTKKQPAAAKAPSAKKQSTTDQAPSAKKQPAAASAQVGIKCFTVQVDKNFGGNAAQITYQPPLLPAGTKMAVIRVTDASKKTSYVYVDSGSQTVYSLEPASSVEKKGTILGSTTGKYCAGSVGKITPAGYEFYLPPMNEFKNYSKVEIVNYSIDGRNLKLGASLDITAQVKKQ